ncbi:MAG: LysR family transcriptional regulator [Clostridiales bacterium]|nr:LysR family transcriptional regulator [Clostridiales bacterium]
MNVNLEYYRIFYYVVKHSSITGAATELCISQPAVSQAIKMLETSLESKLFIRMAKGVALTQEGEALYSYVKQGYESIMKGEATVKRMQNLDVGEIRIGASDMTLQFYLLPFLEEFHELYPNIKVTVTNGPTPETIQFLHDGHIDFGVVSEPFTTTDHDLVSKVARIQDTFVAGRRFWELKHRQICLEDLARMPIICLEKNTSTRAYMDSVLKKAGVSITPEFELATSDMIVQFALRSLGIGMVVKSFAQPYLNSGELFELQIRSKIPERHFCIIQDKRFPLSSAARRLLEMFEEL